MIGKIIPIILIIAWLALVLVGKGGFVHLLLLASICTGMVEVMALYRARMMSGEDKL